jgi:hypothetical protein
LQKFFINNLWRWKCNLPEKEQSETSYLNLEDLKKTEWSTEFENLMRNRLIMGAIRYGKLGDKNKPQYDRIQSCKDRLDAYEKTGNTEHLVDVANLALLTFVEDDHPEKHFHAIDDGVHTKIKGK